MERLIIFCENPTIGPTLGAIFERVARFFNGKISIFFVEIPRWAPFSRTSTRFFFEKIILFLFNLLNLNSFLRNYR